jgi:hypothetical protein
MTLFWETSRVYNNVTHKKVLKIIFFGSIFFREHLFIYLRAQLYAFKFIIDT